MSPVTMRKLELFVLKKDIDPVLERLGEARCFQIAAPQRDPLRAAEKEAVLHPAGPDPQDGLRRGGSYERASAKLRQIRDGLGLQPPRSVPAGTRLPTEADEPLIDELSRLVLDLSAEESDNAKSLARLHEALDETMALAGLSMPFRELDHLSFLALRIGHVEADRLPELAASLGERAIVLPLNERGDIVAAAAKKGRYALDTELERVKFKPRELPPGFTGLPPELPRALQAELLELESKAQAIALRKAALKTELGPRWEKLAASYQVATSIEAVKASLDVSDFVYRLEGWVPKELVRQLALDLKKASGGRVALRVYAPEELESVKSGREVVPVLLKRRAFVSSFDGLIVSYGIPLYGTVDPTPLVAFFFVLLFSIMFGDMGQGLVLLLIGLALRGRWLSPPVSWTKFAPIFLAVGAGSMLMGFLTGSVFCDERLLVPLTRSLSLTLFGRPLDRFLSLMPDGGTDKLFAFFGFTLGIGVLINSTGLLVNIVNKLRLGKYGQAIFAKTGLAGALFFWWALGIGVRMLLKGALHWFDALGLGLPLLALFFAEPLCALLEPRAEEHEKQGFTALVVGGLVEIIESVSYYFSNTLSFLRVGAFALSHTVLSFIVFTMGELLRSKSPAGFIGMILVSIFGNALIIGLEGMIVAIQTVRLQYYEFFSKFFTETGKLFSPFGFEYKGSDV